MDPWINSLVQSPLVRSLNTVPSRLGSFAHGVKDNVPPFSFTKIPVDPYTTTQSASGVHKFRIPQAGLLDRMYLKVWMRRKYAAATGTAPSVGVVSPADNAARLFLQNGVQATHSSSMNYAAALGDIVLQTRNRIIQTLPAECIASEVQRMPSEHRDFYLRSMAGFALLKHDDLVTATLQDLVPTGLLWDPSAAILSQTITYAATPSLTVSAWTLFDVPAYTRRHLYAMFIVPLPFAVLDQLKDNFQTRFVEDLEVSVQTKAFQAIHNNNEASGSDGYVLQLQCIYHNFHDIIENGIRETNYKRGFPASIYSYDFMEETNITPPATAGGSYIIDLKSNNLVTEIILVEQSTQGYRYDVSFNHGAVTDADVAGSNGTTTRVDHRVTLRGSGRDLWVSRLSELRGPDSQDYSLTEGHPWGGDASLAAVSGNMISRSPYQPRTTSVTPVATSVLTSTAAYGGVLLSFAQNVSVMRFGFQAHSEFYTGGLALQTISNPQIIITPAVANAATYATNRTFRCYVKYACILRIDSDTGVITRTLDV